MVSHLIQKHCQYNRKREAEKQAQKTDCQCISNQSPGLIGFKESLKLLQADPGTSPNSLRCAELFEGNDNPIHRAIAKYQKNR